MTFLYEFEKAGIIVADSLNEAIRKTHSYYQDVRIEYSKPESGNQIDIIAVSRNTIVDSLVRAKVTYPKPEGYCPPPDGYQGEDDWYYKEIMRFRSEGEKKLIEKNL